MESGTGYEAKALVFASGMAAMMAVFGVVLRPGDVVVMPSNSYYAARLLVQEYFTQMGVVVRMAPTAGNAQGRASGGGAAAVAGDAEQSDDGGVRHCGAVRGGA